MTTWFQLLDPLPEPPMGPPTTDPCGGCCICLPRSGLWFAFGGVLPHPPCCCGATAPHEAPVLALVGGDPQALVPLLSELSPPPRRRRQRDALNPSASNRLWRSDNLKSSSNDVYPDGSFLVCNVTVIVLGVPATTAMGIASVL